MWAQLAMAGLNIMEGQKKARYMRKLSKAQYEFDKSAASNKALNNASNNMLAMADANLARYNQRRQDKHTLDKFGSDWSQNAYNSSKVMDGLNSKRFNDRLASAGNLGAIVAAAAAAGVGGASVQQNMQTERMRQQRQDDANVQQQQDVQYADNLNRVAMIDNAYNQLSTDPAFANLNYQATDMVVDNSWQYKYGIDKLLKDGMGGFSGNMNNTGADMSNWTAGKEKSGATGFGSAANSLSWLGIGGSGKSSGGGATRL